MEEDIFIQMSLIMSGPAIECRTLHYARQPAINQMTMNKKRLRRQRNEKNKNQTKKLAWPYPPVETGQSKRQRVHKNVREGGNKKQSDLTNQEDILLT